MTTNHMGAMFLLGAAVGMHLPSFPAPFDFIRGYLPIIFIIIAVILLLKG